jgi:mannose-6-phosphate isomerase-like protein (cupin superfamily)
MAEGIPINLADKLATFADHWSPKIVETVDGYDVKLVKVRGDFVWQRHDDEDELFLVLKGRLRMDFRDRQVDLQAGEMIVVPKGVEHKPCAAEECEMLVFERAGVVNTGDAAPNVLTQARTERI